MQNKSNNSTSQANDQILEQRKQEIGNFLCTSINSNQPTKLDLSKKGLKSFDEIYQIIYDHAKKNPKTKYDFQKLNIKELDVSGNQMRHFFNEANFDSRSVFKKNQKALKLTSVTHLNFLNNLQLNSIQESVLQIQYLMPNIKSLEMSLSDEEDVSFIILNMPQLEELNQIKVDRTQSSENNEESLETKPPEKDQKIKKQPFEIKEQEEEKEDDFFEQNFRKDDSHSEFKISPSHINLEQSNTPNLRNKDQNVQQHLNADIISEIETTLKINQKTIQESFDDSQIEYSEISSSNQIKRKKKSERKNKSQNRLSSNLRQSKIIEKQNLSFIESPTKQKCKIQNQQSPFKESLKQNEIKIDQKEKRDQSPLSKSFYQEENFVSENQIDQNKYESKNFINQNFENNYIQKKTSSEQIQNAQKPKCSQTIKTKNDQISFDDPITVEQIKNQDSKESNYQNSSKETEQYEHLRSNILNLNKDLKGVSDISLQLLNQNLQSPEKYLKFTQMLYNQQKTQDSNSIQSAHHIESQEELQKFDQREIQRFDDYQDQKMQKIELQFNQQNYQNTYFPIRQLNKQQLINENLIAEKILHEYNEEMTRTPNQLSDIIEDEREAENENGLSKGTCNFGNSYSRANNSVQGQNYQVQSYTSSQSLPQQVSLNGIGIGLKEFSSTMQSQNNNLKENHQIQKFKEDKNVQSHIYSQEKYSINQELLSPVLQNRNLNEEKENIIVLHQTQNSIQNIESPKKQKSFNGFNQEQDQQEQDIILKSSRKLQKFIDEKRVKEKILNQENPTLKPTDLEDLANIFDRIRILFKKKSSSNQPQPKKLILKNVGPTDDLAIQFDQKLTDIMFQLSKILKDNLVTSHQKNAEIEKSKFLLYIYCNQTCIKFISKYKGNILQKDAKEVEQILQKLNDILSLSFVKLVSTFYTKEDNELKLISQIQIENLKQECKNFEQVRQNYDYAVQELNQNKNEIFNLKESFLNQSIRLEEQHFQLRKSEENFNELMYAREEIVKLRQQMANYDQVLGENQQIKNELYRLKEFVQDQNKLKKSAYSKEKECQKLRKMVSHLQEEIRDMKEEGICLFDENQKYLDMIVRYSLGQEKGQNGGMKVNLDWLKSRILRKKKSIYDGHSAFDLKSQMSQSNVSVSPIIRTQKFNQNKINLGFKNGKKNQKFNDLSIRSIQSQNSCESQNGIQKQFKQDTKKSEITQKIESIQDINEKLNQRSNNPRNASKSSKFGDKLGQMNEAVFPKEGGYSNIHSYRKSFKKSPMNNDFNLSYQQSKDRQKSLVFNTKNINLQERGYDKDLESEKSNFLIKSQNSQKSQDVFQNKQGEEKEELQRTAAKKLQKVESQLIEKSFTKEILGIQNNKSNIASPNKLIENESINNIKQHQQISVEDCEPSPSKQFKNTQKNLILNNNQNQQKLNVQNDLKLRLGSIKNSNISNETSENERFLRQEKEIQMSLQNQNINANSNQKVPHLNLNDNEHKYTNHYIQQKHQRNFSASNYSIGYFKNGMHENLQTQTQKINNNIYSKRSKSASPKHNKDGISINNKINFFEYNMTYSNQQSAQNHLQLQDIIRRKLHQIDMFKANKGNQNLHDKINYNDDNVKSPDIYKIRDFQPFMQQKEVLSPDLKKQGTKNCKYSLKQIRELITDIYIQKVKHDDKCINMIHQNRETMQQFLCTYLNQKYGLKQIVHEQANAIIQGIADYQFIDHDVLLFKKVLKNQIDEEFRYVQITIKNTVYQLMKTFLTQKYPTKISYDIQRMIVDIENGKTPIDNWLWQKILNQMYDKTDQFIIFEKLKKMENLFQMEKQYNSESKSPHPVLATNLRAESRKRSKDLMGRRSVGFNRNSVGSQNVQNPSDTDKQPKDGIKKLSKYTNNQNSHPKYQFQIFMETILLFQLNEHEKFLQKFMQLFQSIDTLQSGIISNQQFIQLCKKMNIHNNGQENYSKNMEEINKLLDIIDPYQSNKITLSDIILLFSKHNLNMLEGNILKSSNKKQNFNVDLSVQGLNRLNDLEKSQSFNLNLTKKNLDPQPEQFIQNQANSEQNYSLTNANDNQKHQFSFTNVQKQILMQKLGDLQQIDETTESNMLFTADNSRQASNQISMVEKSNNFDQFNIVNHSSFYNLVKQNEGKDTIGSMETINKISEDEKRIQFEIMMLERQLESKI